ncbi:MAG: NADH-quinone oxidoreductase subunit NuoE [Terriglobales bacterium]
MSVFSPALDARLNELAAAYPQRRSALVPMLLYAQDELGWLTPEAIAEIAERLGETQLAVRETIGYYSMLRTRPAGRYHVQVCTNISCLLRGGEELLEHCRKRLGLEQREVTADGMFSIEEVECIGACSWAPAMQVNYDFHENLDPAKADQVLAEYRQKG